MATTRSAAPPEAAATSKRGADGVRTLKKYPNRRLYDTQTSSYITLADVKKMVLDHDRFCVRDAKTGEDLTRSILLQIILEEESGGAPVFSEQMLAQIIRFYGHTMQGLMGSYLEKNLQAFVELQSRFAEQAQKTFGTDTWTQMMSVQNPMMQGFMNSYMEQSRAIAAQMQDQMQKQAASLFQGMPGLAPRT